MIRVKILLCVGISFLYTPSLIAQAPPKKKTVTNVVGYRQYQQQQWNKNQLPQNSVQYKTDIKYKTQGDNNKSIPNLHLPQRPVPVVKKVFYDSATYVFNPGLKFLIPDTASYHYKWQTENWRQYLPGRNQ